VRTGCQPHKGDLLFSKDGTVGRTAVVDSEREFVVASSLVIISPQSKRLHSKFLDYWLNNALLQQDIQLQMSGAALRRISVEKVSRLPVFLPSVAEQSVIAAFLDTETGRMDQLLEKKQELIDRLKEKRAALISRTVTRGLPPYAARAAGLPESFTLKRIDLEHISEIPTHWKVLPFTKYVAEKSDYRGKTPEKQSDGVFLVTAKNIRMGFIDYGLSQEFVAAEDYDEIMRRGLPKKGDILFTTEAPLGNVALVDREDVALAQRIIRFRMTPTSFDSKFTLFAMMSDHFQVQLKSLSTGSTAEGLKASKLPLLG
jgi:type I restriction enzyme S subunit